MHYPNDLLQLQIRILKEGACTKRYHLLASVTWGSLLMVLVTFALHRLSCDWVEFRV